MQKLPPHLANVVGVSPTSWGKWGKGLRGREGARLVTGIIERHIEAHYEVQDVQMGKVYRWCPESVVFKCECGEELVLTASSSTICGECGADHKAIVEEALDSRSGDEVYRPWRSRCPYYAPTRGT